jgi:iron complex outermembrane receptor protein
VVGGVFLSHVELTRDFLRGPVLSYANWRATSKQDVYAGFGQADWRVGHGLSFTGGLRYQHEDIGYTFQERNPAAPALYSGDSSDGFWTYKLGVQEQVTPDVMLFGSYSTGHKGETYDLTSGFNQARANRGPIGPETSKAWEGGIRAQGFDRRVTLNMTAFSTSYHGLQSQGYDPILDQIYLINLADARTRGVESTLAVRATSAIRLSGSLAYTDATIRNAFNVSCYGGQTVAQGCVNGHQDITDKTLPNAPKWKGTTQVDLDQRLGSSPFDVIGTAFLSYQSKVNYSINQNPVTAADGYALVNLSLGMRQRDKGYQVSVFVNNLFDKHYSASLTDIGNKYGVTAPASIGVANFAARDERRYFGVRGSIRY